MDWEKRQYRMALARRRAFFTPWLGKTLEDRQALLVRRWGASPLDLRRRSGFLQAFKQGETRSRRARLRQVLARYMAGDDQAEDLLSYAPRRGHKMWTLF